MKTDYKQTEAGFIPEDWECNPLVDYISEMTDYVAAGSFESLRNNVKVYDSTNYALYVRLFDLRLGIGHLKQKYVDEGSYKFLKKSNLFGGEVLVANIGANVGEFFLMPSVKDKATLAPNMIIIRSNESLVTNQYLYYYSSSFIGQKMVCLQIAGSGQPKLNKTDLKKMFVVLPPKKEEQEAIAEALSDADALIASLEQLIAKKRHIKQGAMQELLTGKRRLPGFEKKKGYKQTEAGSVPEDWKEVEFNSVVSQYIDYRGRTPLKLGMNWGGGEIPALSANNVEMGKINFDKECYLASDQLYKKWMQQGSCEKGDILLTMEAPLGNVAQIPDGSKYVLSQRVLLIKVKDYVEPDYFYHYMRGIDFQRQLLLNATGSTAQGIQRAKLELIPVIIPTDVAEQVAIAHVLGDIDDSIESLERRLRKAECIKQAMMQELLTGRIRLI